MKFSLRVLPFILFFVFFALIQGAFKSLKYFEEVEDAKEMKVLQETAVDRFKRYLDLPILMTKLGSKYIAESGINTANYEKFAKVVKEGNPEFLGFNLLNDQGVIIRVFPDVGENAKARGKTTQMLANLLASKERREPFYFSEPFRLYQGKQGFVVYVPMVTSTNKFIGWNSVVISSEDFIKTFRLEDFLALFDLAILDKETGLDYFATSVSPMAGAKVFEQNFRIFNRDFLLRTWRKGEVVHEQFPWYFSAIISLILSIGAAFIISLAEQRRRARSQLDNISSLLRVTSKEALNNLIDIHSEFIRLKISDDERLDRLTRDINYLTDLVEQIDLLQTLAHNREGLSGTVLDVATQVENQIENFGDIIEKKKILPVYDRKALEKVKLNVNEWLFGHSVLSNVFSHLLIQIRQGSRLTIDAQSRGPWQMIIFRIQRFQEAENTSVIARRIDVARKVLQLHQGDLKEELTHDEIVIRILLPK